MAKLRATPRPRSHSRSRTPPPCPGTTMPPGLPIEDTTIGKAYASPFLALLARNDGEVARMNSDPLHGFFLPPREVVAKSTVVRGPALKAIANYLPPYDGPQASKNDGVKETLKSAYTTTFPKTKLTATRGRIAPTLVIGDEIKQSTVLCRKAAHDDDNPAATLRSCRQSVTALDLLEGRRVKLREQFALRPPSKGSIAPIQSHMITTLNPVTIVDGGPDASSGVVKLEATRLAETESASEAAFHAELTEMDGFDFDFAEVLRAFWMKDAVFHRRLSTLAFFAVLLMVFGKWLFV